MEPGIELCGDDTLGRQVPWSSESVISARPSALMISFPGPLAWE